MNTRTKQLALLATCGFFLVACGQNKGDQVTRQVTKNIFDFTSLPGITEETKEIIAKAQKETVEATYKIAKEQFKDMEGFLVKLETEGEKLIQSFDMDYTKMNILRASKP